MIATNAIPVMHANTLREFRCDCGKLLFKGRLSSSVVEIKCKRCGAMCLFDEA